MSVELTILISLVSVALNIVATVVNVRRGYALDTKCETTEMTTVIVKLETIGTDVAEIKADMRRLNDDVRNHAERIVSLEQSVKSAWKIIDRMQGYENRKGAKHENHESNV